MNYCIKLNEENIKCEACQALYRFLQKKVNKLNNTGAYMLDSKYQMTQAIL